MDIQNQNFISFINLAEQKFEAKYKEYIEKKRNDEAEANRKLGEISNLLNQLSNHKSMIKNPILAQRFLDILNRISQTNISGTPSYAKLVYYLNRLNDIKHDEFALKNNPSYCNTVLTKIAQQYILIYRKLESDKKSIEVQFKAESDRLFNEYKNAMQENAYAVVKRARQYAGVEADALIKQIEDSI